MCGFSFIQSEGSNTDKVSRRPERRNVKFKLLFSPTSASEGKKKEITAVQKIDLIDGKAQDPIIVEPLLVEEYEPQKLDKRIPESRSAYWTGIKKMLEEFLRLSRKFERGCGSYWTWDSSQGIPFQSLGDQCKYKIIVNVILSVMHESMSTVAHMMFLRVFLNL